MGAVTAAIAHEEQAIGPLDQRASNGPTPHRPILASRRTVGRGLRRFDTGRTGWARSPLTAEGPAGLGLAAWLCSAHGVTDAPLHPNAAAVVAAAAAAGLRIEPVEYPEGTRSAADAAAAIGCAEAQIVKSLIFGVEASDELLLALVSGANRLDERRLAGAAEVTGTRRADADAVRAVTGFPIGGVPPFGHTVTLRVFVDPDLLRWDVVWAAAGTPRHVFSLTPAELVSATGGVVVPLAAD